MNLCEHMSQIDKAKHIYEQKRQEIHIKHRLKKNNR